MIEKIKEILKRANHEIWKPFDSGDPLEWYLICFGFFMILLMGVLAL